MGYIYLLTNKINNKKYVGQTVSKNITSRWNTYKKLIKCSIGRYLYNALIKYGLENFKFQIICICFDEDCNNYEQYYIKHYNTIVPNGYNLQSGGNFSKQHPESIQKRITTMRNSPKYEEYKKNISARLIGDKNPNFGKKMSEEQKKKMSEARKNRQNKECSDELKKKISDGLKRYYSNTNTTSSLCKKIGKYSLNDELIETYPSLSAAARSVENGSYLNIGRCCSDKYVHYKTYKGFKWKYSTN